MFCYYYCYFWLFSVLANKHCATQTGLIQYKTCCLIVIQLSSQHCSCAFCAVLVVVSGVNYRPLGALQHNTKLDEQKFKCDRLAVLEQFANVQFAQLWRGGGGSLLTYLFPFFYIINIKSIIYGYTINKMVI